LRRRPVGKELSEMRHFFIGDPLNHVIGTLTKSPLKPKIKDAMLFLVGRTAFASSPVFSAVRRKALSRGD
jgi:hypothetical protein